MFSDPFFWLEQIVFLWGAVRLRFDDHLMRVIDGGDADVALHDTVTTLERGALRVGQIALDRRAFGTETLGRGGQR